MSDYEAFLASKRVLVSNCGIDVPVGDLNPMLFPFQRDIVHWALHKGRSAIFADCGLGKTPMQLEWARHVASHNGRPVLILAPLAVSQQTMREGEKFGVPVTVCRHQGDVQPGVNIANYEMLSHFDAGAFGGLVVDESSILKSYDGVYRQQITAFAGHIGFRLACTATPAPNDLIEIVNHAEYLGVMKGKEIMAMFFTQDGNSTHSWRLKGHARRDFWQWLASWSVALRRPSDIGHSDEGFALPPLEVHQETVDAEAPPGYLFPVEAQTLSERLAARRESIAERVADCAALVNASAEPWLVWCNLNAESEALVRAIPDAIEVRGSDSAEVKEQRLLDFSLGNARVLVSKPSICGHGMNWQHCHNMAFVGLSDSWEQWYQAVRRCWRFGQTQPVHAHIIVAETEGAVVENIRRKERQATEMMDNLVEHVRLLQMDRVGRQEMDYRENRQAGKHWTMYLGDSVEVLDELKTASVGLTVFSPPFPGMYAYTNSARDMGNTRDMDEMLRQFRFMVGAEKLYRVMMPGRMVAMHITQAPAFKNRDGYVGMHDFRGHLIQMMIDEGWIYYGEVTIDKNPQLKAQRTKEQGLLFKSLANDSAVMRMAMADYLLYFKKPGENPRPIRAGISAKYGNPDGWITQDEWIEWAAPVWYRKTPDYPGGISETDVLNVRQARETDDERHLCPLQLGVCERAIKLWSAPGDLVLDPFAGIGSVGYEAVRLSRRFVGIELKASYWASAIENLQKAEADIDQPTLFDLIDDVPA